MTSKTDLRRVGIEPLAPFVRNLIFPLWVIRDHPGYYRYLREFQKTQFLRPDGLRDLQVGKLKILLEHAYANCPYYRGRADQAQMPPSAVNCLEDFKKFPILTKRDIQDNGPSMLATNIPPSRRARNQTGGSTGSPLQFYVDKERFASRAASTTRHNLWAGLRSGDWCASLWGARLDQLIKPGPKDWLKNVLLYRMLELNTSRIDASDWEAFVTRLRKYRPRYMIAYAQSAVKLAQYVQQRGIKDLGFDSIITTAEVLLPDNRTLLEETFRAQVFNRYGCRELSVIASECEHHQMHVNADALLVEIIFDGKRPDDCGRIVITDLLNYSMPLIRYDICDLGAWAPEQSCACGRGLPIVREVRGRTTDFIVLKDGTQISGPSLTLVIADMPDVRQVQLVQTALDRITIRVVPGIGYDDATRNELHTRLSLYVQNQAQLTIEEVQNIEVGLSGKYRFVINESHGAGSLSADVSSGQIHARD